jgi:DNA helicase II / ATP-dependent DNA helicase PcrA
MSDNLNPEQSAAVQTLSGPLLVLAGAGTGKTRVVTFRIANLIRHGTRPDRILAVTFTNKAAQEMLHRVTEKLGKPKRAPRGAPQPPRPVIGTFHSNCLQILRRHARVMGYPERFAIYDRSDQEAVARDVLRQLRVHEGMMRPGDLLAHISRWKNGGMRPDQAMDEARTDAEHVAASGYRRYQQAVKLAGAVDFDDLLLVTEELFATHEPIRAAEAGRFDHVLVDEYQDTNQSQYRIIKFLSKDHRNLCVVGDDDQSIYGWRGAEVTHILNFRNDWPDATVVRLESNYRSVAPILDAANRLIVFNKHRHDKQLRPSRMGGQPPRVLQFKNDVEEARQITHEIARTLDRRVREPRDIAILFRTNEQPRAFETELRKAKVPYVLMGSQSFFDRKEVRDLLSYLKFIDNPRDEVALLRIINTPPRGLGAKSVETLLARAVTAGEPVWEMVNRPTITAELPEPARRGCRLLQQLVQTFKQRLEAKEELAEVVRSLIADTGYMADLTRQYPEPEELQMRQGSVEEVVNSVAEYAAEADEPTLSGFLDQVTLAGREFGSPKDKAKQQNAVWLMTYHSAKGLEFPIVYMVGMEEGVLPHSRSLRDNPDDVDEERRLCYVGITRAQEELSLTLPLERMKWGKPRPTFPSRFLYELTGQADNPNRIAAINGARKELLRGKSAGGKGPPAGKGSSAQSGSKSGGNQGSGPKSGGSPPGNSRPAPRRSTG